MADIVTRARAKALDRGVGLSYDELVEVLRLPDARVDALLGLSQQVWWAYHHDERGTRAPGQPAGSRDCAASCYFCAQSDQFTSPVRTVRLDVPQLVRAAESAAASGATEFCIAAPVRAADEPLMSQVREAVVAIRGRVDIKISTALGMLTEDQAQDLKSVGVSGYSHNLETARSFFAALVTTHSWEERWETCLIARDAGLELCVGGLLGIGESLEQRAELASQLACLDPVTVPLNLLSPRSGPGSAARPALSVHDTLRAIAAFRLALPRTRLRYAGPMLDPLRDRGDLGVWTRGRAELP